MSIIIHVFISDISQVINNFLSLEFVLASEA
jgi:hypothetical protein